MCGRFTLRRDLGSVRRELAVDAGGGSVLYEPHYNIAPTQQTLILTSEAEHGPPDRADGLGYPAKQRWHWGVSQTAGWRRDVNSNSQTRS
jgi:putative SOS response-associated peptidase YedK